MRLSGFFKKLFDVLWLNYIAYQQINNYLILLNL
jgi:hypothetical protein